MKGEKKTQTELPLDTPLNPVVNVSTGLDTNNLLKSEGAYAGDSVDEHTELEEANEYFAEKEIGQVNRNS